MALSEFVPGFRREKEDPQIRYSQSEESLRDAGLVFTASLDELMETGRIEPYQEAMGGIRQAVSRFLEARNALKALGQPMGAEHSTVFNGLGITEEGVKEAERKMDPDPLGGYSKRSHGGGRGIYSNIRIKNH